MASSHRFAKAVAGAAMVGAAALGTAGAFGAGQAAATTCGLKDSQGIVRCDDGSYQYVDHRGHLIIKDRYGTVIMDLSPGQPWY